VATSPAHQANHQQAQLFKQKAIARYGEEPTSSAAVLALFVIGLVLLLRRGRRSKAPISPVPMPVSPAGDTGTAMRVRQCWAGSCRCGAGAGCGAHAAEPAQRAVRGADAGAT
jgi:MYXO-CTERM domain-containing protein